MRYTNSSVASKAGAWAASYYTNYKSVVKYGLSPTKRKHIALKLLGMLIILVEGYPLMDMDHFGVVFMAPIIF
ncbi:hypothetical protein EDO6_03861 [Paenibacillus xylanexedens]|nr:hypothetical protein EDO6_03861 [Paenibacillus xylanexedens]